MCTTVADEGSPPDETPRGELDEHQRRGTIRPARDTSETRWTILDRNNYLTTQ